MIRGTTPTHIFSIKDMDPRNFQMIKIYYAQQGVELFSKTMEDCTFSEKETEDGTMYFVSVTLTQEETNSFKAKQNVEIQMRALTADNKALATPEYKVPVSDVINDEILEV